MKNKSENLLPKILRGTVHEQFVRCGKPNCKCVRGELHGAYFYHFIRVNGKLKKRYLRRDEVESWRLACGENQKREKAQRLEQSATWQLLRRLRSDLRRYSR